MPIEKFNSYSNLKYQFYACKRSLENYPPNLIAENYDIAVKRYSNFLREKIKNPILTDIVIKAVIEEHPIENIDFFTKNLETLEKDPEIKLLLDEEAKKQALYKRTGAIREKLTEENRFKFSYVTPKLKGFEKFMLKLKLMF